MIAMRVTTYDDLAVSRHDEGRQSAMTHASDLIIPRRPPAVSTDPARRSCSFISSINAAAAAAEAAKNAAADSSLPAYASCSLDRHFHA